MHRPVRYRPLSILDAMVIIAGIAFGLWLLQEQWAPDQSAFDADRSMILAIGFFGGISLAMAPLIILDRIRGIGRFRAGTMHALAVGLAGWALTPALVILRLEISDHPSSAEACFMYSLPLMGLFLLIASLVGDPRPERLAPRGHWSNWLGMWLITGWAAVGCYVLYLIYADLL